LAAVSSAQTITSAEALSCSDESTIRPKATGVGGYTNFENGSDGDIQVFKLEQNGGRRLYQRLRAQYAYQEYTEPGEIWLITDANGKCKSLFLTISTANRARVGESPIISRRGIPPFTMETTISAGYSLQPDDKGTYRHGRDSVSSTMCEALNLWLDVINPNKSPIRACGVPQRRTEPGDDRFIAFDLTLPIVGSGARDRGVVRANTAAMNVFWKHDHDARTTYSIQALPPGKTSKSERLNLNLTMDGKRHMLQFGSWAPGEFASPLQNVHGKGTTETVLIRYSETEWTVEAQEGSVGRLWDISDGKKAVDEGLYQFSFKVRFELLPDMIH